MTSETVAKETREGTVFTAHVGRLRRGMVPVRFFVEGQEKPVGTVNLPSWEGSGNPEGIVDKAFQKWVIDGLFHKTVKDPGLLSILGSAQRERLEDTPWYQRTFRFLRAGGSTRFILTTDKNDLPDHSKRIREVGECVVARDEEGARTEHEQLIRAVAKMAINNKVVPADSVRTISQLGLLEPSTSFRGVTQFPGESSVLRYEFTEEGTEYAGYIGFDSDLRLISVDERFPENKQVYLR